MVDLRRSKNNAGDTPGVCARKNGNGDILSYMAYIYVDGDKVYLGHYSVNKIGSQKEALKQALEARKKAEVDFWGIDKMLEPKRRKC